MSQQMAGKGKQRFEKVTFAAAHLNPEICLLPPSLLIVSMYDSKKARKREKETESVCILNVEDSLRSEL